MEDRLEHPDTVREKERGSQRVSDVSFIPGVLPQQFALSPFAGGNGAMDRVSHFLLGRSDWTESQEDLRLVGIFFCLFFVFEILKLHLCF